jgi:hypothetical protein
MGEPVASLWGGARLSPHLSQISEAKIAEEQKPVYFTGNGTANSALSF